MSWPFLSSRVVHEAQDYMLEMLLCWRGGYDGTIGEGISHTEGTHAQIDLLPLCAMSWACRTDLNGRELQDRRTQQKLLARKMTYPR